ncbi:unnamed protein product [Kuraishia capsulata CBS 1993]|uniref:DUF3020 domain-containing protein n=1 Tax=Kuraishia capsulata CBS 1993 TaxID=1382522 RepID=W6MR85_9ASCO|nr:uncharacterized protein KUCA_T00004858001 [Kuraishia capsulata CBS 1993]CDK28873.1 unnamed protein product [Kuraishia capsulata CBS 1993]
MDTDRGDSHLTSGEAASQAEAFQFDLDDDILKNLVNQVAEAHHADDNDDDETKRTNQELIDLQHMSVDALNGLVDDVRLLDPHQTEKPELENAILDRLVEDTVGLLEKAAQDPEDTDQTQRQSEPSEEVQEQAPQPAEGAEGATDESALELGDAIREALEEHQKAPSTPASEPEHETGSGNDAASDAEIPAELLRQLAMQTFEQLEDKDHEDSEALQAALAQMVKDVVENNETVKEPHDDDLDLNEILQNAMELAMENPTDLLTNMEEALRDETRKRPKKKTRAGKVENHTETGSTAVESKASPPKPEPPKKVTLSIAETLALTRARMNYARTSGPGGSSELSRSSTGPDPRTLIAQRLAPPASKSQHRARFGNWTNLSFTSLRAMTGALLTTISRLDGGAGNYIDKRPLSSGDDLRPADMPLGDSPEDIKLRIKIENRIRKKKWRERNSEKNKDNDLRARLMKRAIQLFPQDSQESDRKSWFDKEFGRRKEKRLARENDIAHDMGSSVVGDIVADSSSSPSHSGANQEGSTEDTRAPPPPRPSTISESLALSGVKVDSIPGLTDPNLLRNLATVYSTFGNVPGSDKDSAVATTATAVASAYTAANKDDKSDERVHLTEILKTMLTSLLDLVPPQSERQGIEHTEGSIPGVPTGVISFKVRRDNPSTSPKPVSEPNAPPSRQLDMGLTALVKRNRGFDSNNAFSAANTPSQPHQPRVEKRKPDESIESILKRQRTELEDRVKAVPWATAFKPPQYKKPGGGMPTTAAPAGVPDGGSISSPAPKPLPTSTPSPQIRPMLGASLLGTPPSAIGVGMGLRKPGAFRKPQGYANPGAQSSPDTARPFSGIQFRKS